MTENEPTILHFTRVRAKGDSTYYDPQSDIRAIFPTAAKLTLDLLMETIQDDNAKREFEYLAKCYHIYQIRLTEDGTSLLKQALEFANAIKKVRPAIRWAWQTTMLTLLNSLYALFTRRDVKTDGKAIKGMLNMAQEAALLQQLPKDKQEVLYAAFNNIGAIPEEDPTTDPNGKVVCEETEQVIENIKDLAQVFISHTGDGSWDSLAAACDAFFSSPDADKATDEQKIAVALAYPTYETPYLTVEKTEE